MTDLIGRYLDRLLRGCGADAAVLWSRIGRSSAASVICTHPTGLLPVAAPWPATEPMASGVIQRDPAVVAGLAPTSLRLELPKPPGAALSLELGDHDLVLLLIWFEAPAGDELAEDLRTLITDEITDAAGCLAERHRLMRESQRLESVVGELKQGVVSVDHSLDQVTLNPAAAHLLHRAPGVCATWEFAAAMTDLEGRALNGPEIAGMGRQLLTDPWTNMECTFRFTHAPTHVRVSSHAIRQGAYSGRVWVFDDVSAAAQALEASQTAQTTLRAIADSLLDPQVLLEAVRDTDGRVVDFRYLSVNRATCDYLGLAESDLVGHTQLESTPNLKDSEIHRRYIQCLEDGEPVILDDFAFFNEILDDARRYDIRATRAGANLLSLTWRDVTDRFRAVQRIADSEALLRASADSMLDPQALLEAVRDSDGRVVDFRYRSVNKAACLYLGLQESDLVGHTQLESTPNMEGSELQRLYIECLQDGEPVILDDFAYFNEILGDARRYDIRATRAGDDLLSLTWSDVTDRFHAVQTIAESEHNYRLLAENSGDVIVRIRDGRIAWVSPSVEAALGAPPHYWVGRQLQETVPAEETPDLAARTATVLAGGVVQRRVRVIAADGAVHWFHMFAKPFYGADGRQDGALSTLRLIDDEVVAEQEAHEARRQQARAEARYRRSMDSAPIGMCLIAPEGTFVEVNGALCELFGYNADTLKHKTWQELTAPEYLQADLQNVDDVLAGRIDSYRIRKQYLHADGHRIWGDLAVSCIRDQNGQVENFIKQIVDITATVEANEQNRLLTKRLQRQSDRMAAELESAASYMASIMPSGLTGPVEVVSRYLPSRELGGDCFDYTWIDDDHLLVYLIDVSGHGIEPALFSVSVHNMLRSRSLGIETMLVPDAALAELNRLFQMEDQGDHYFTIWYGLYEASTRTLRYASAGAPPAFAFGAAVDGSVSVTELFTAATPIGMFADTEFTSRSYPVPPGCRILIYSDGAHELSHNEGHVLSVKEFKNMNTRLAASPNWSIDTLLKELQALNPAGAFEDDCSLIHLTFD